MDIATALRRIREIQAGMSIVSPIPVSIQRAYYLYPKQTGVIDTPAWINTWTLVGEQRAPSSRIQTYTVNMQLLVQNADLDFAGEIATAFMPVVVDAFDDDVTLGGAVTYTELRSGGQTLAMLDYGRESYAGLDLLLDLTLDEVRTFS